jgi:hypothetical protein
LPWSFQRSLRRRLRMQVRRRESTGRQRHPLAQAEGYVQGLRGMPGDGDGPSGELHHGVEEARLDNEEPWRMVIIARPFAVGRFEVTFAAWLAATACTGLGPRKAAGDQRLLERHHQGYLPWLLRNTGKTYRLGVCGAGRHDEALLERQDDHAGAGQIRRLLHLWWQCEPRGIPPALGCRMGAPATLFRRSR